MRYQFSSDDLPPFSYIPLGVWSHIRHRAAPKDELHLLLYEPPFLRSSVIFFIPLLLYGVAFDLKALEEMISPSYFTLHAHAQTMDEENDQRAECPGPA